MKQDNSSIFGIIAFAFMMAASACGYLWSEIGGAAYQRCGYLTLLFGVCFVITMGKVISIVERRVNETGGEDAYFEGLHS